MRSNKVSRVLLGVGIAFGCGNNENRRLGVAGRKQLKPVQCNFEVVEVITEDVEVAIVDANIETCVIDCNGKLEVNGVKQIRLIKPIKTRMCKI